ncbi:MAG: hypothetical protein RSE22_05440 [Mucinivorans sp.]
MEQKPMLPNAVSTLVLGICSIVFTFFFVGLVLAIIGLAISGSGMRIYRDNPTVWTGYSMLSAGRVLCIIGTVISSLYALFVLIAVLFVGTVGFWTLGACL